MRKRIKLTESDIRRMVSETVCRLLREDSARDAAMQDMQDALNGRRCRNNARRRLNKALSAYGEEMRMRREGRVPTKGHKHVSDVWYNTNNDPDAIKRVDDWMDGNEPIPDYQYDFENEFAIQRPRGGLDKSIANDIEALDYFN